MTQVSKERLAELRKSMLAKIGGANFNGMPRLADEPRELLCVIDELAALRDGAGWVRTDERLPTEADADYFHRVLAAEWMASIGWRVCAAYWTQVVQDPTRWMLWMRHPAMPNSMNRDTPFQEPARE